MLIAFVLDNNTIRLHCISIVTKESCGWKWKQEADEDDK